MADNTANIKVNFNTSDLDKATASVDDLKGEFNSLNGAAGNASEGLDDVRGSASRAEGGMGRLLGKLALGAAAFRAIQGAARFASEATREYVEDNEDVQEQLEGMTSAFGEFKTALGRSIVTLAQTSGAVDVLARAMRGLGAAFDAVSGYSASGTAEITNSRALGRARSTLEIAEARLRDMQGGEGEGGGADGNSQQYSRRDIEDQIEVVRQLANQVESGSRNVAQAGVNAVMYSQRLSQFGGPNSRKIEGGEARNAYGFTEEEQNEINRRTQQAADTFRAFYQDLNQQRKDHQEFVKGLMQEEADMERERLRILAGFQKQEIDMRAMKDEMIERQQDKLLRASQDSGGKERSSTKETIDELRGFSTEIVGAFGNVAASGLSEMFDSLFEKVDEGGPKLGTKMRKMLGEQLKAMGQAAVAWGTIALIPPPWNPNGNPVAGGALIGAGTAAMALGSAFGASGGKGNGGAAKPAVPRDFNQSRTFNVTNNIGVVGDPRSAAQVINRTLETGTRQGSRQRV